MFNVMHIIINEWYVFKRINVEIHQKKIYFFNIEQKIYFNRFVTIFYNLYFIRQNAQK